MRIAGVTIPDNKRLEISLTAVYGIGRPAALSILKMTKINIGKRAKELTSNEENIIRKAVESLTIEGDLKRKVASNIKRLKDIKSYRGLRHTRHLPARGQRTKTNARTLKGVKRTMGSGRRKVEKT